MTVISEGADAALLPNEDPIGQRVWFGGGSSFDRPDSSAEIVGIVGDVMYEPLDRPPNRASFYTRTRSSLRLANCILSHGRRLCNRAAVRSALHSVDPDVAMRDVQTLDEIVHGSWARTQFQATLFGSFGVAALLLAASGVFAVLAYAVASRTREFGVRIALGAAPAHVMRIVLREDGVSFIVMLLVCGSSQRRACCRRPVRSLAAEPRVFVGNCGASVVALLRGLIPACALRAQIRCRDSRE